MRVVKDMFGNEVNIGDPIIHITRHSTTVDMHYSIVYGFIWRGGNNVILKVVSAQKSHKGIRYYRASLSVDNFVKTSMDTIPLHIREGLLKKIKV